MGEENDCNNFRRSCAMMSAPAPTHSGRESEARCDRQYGSARCEMQKISAGKFHFEPPFRSLDHLVGGDKQPRWHGQAERTLGDWSSN